jgi:hypothetical protein
MSGTPESFFELPLKKIECDVDLLGPSVCEFLKFGAEIVNSIGVILSYCLSMCLADVLEGVGPLQSKHLGALGFCGGHAVENLVFALREGGPALPIPRPITFQVRFLATSKDYDALAFWTRELCAKEI